MKPSVAHFTIREWQTLRRSRALWVGMLAAGAVLGLIGPFGTDISLSMPLRFIYWTLVSVITFTTGYCLSGGTIAWARAATLPAAVGLTAGSLVAAVFIYGEVLALNLLFFGGMPTSIDVLPLGATVLAIVFIITISIYVIVSKDDQATEGAPRLLDRLPVHIRADLVSISVTDHYVHVTTQKGRHMVLMRLSDAIAETSPTDGFQIHRSHWVARDAIASVARSSRKTEVVLLSGDRLPVSRTYLPQLKEAGFLPKSGT